LNFIYSRWFRMADEENRGTGGWELETRGGAMHWMGYGSIFTSQSLEDSGSKPFNARLSHLLFIEWKIDGLRGWGKKCKILKKYAPLD